MYSNAIRCLTQASTCRMPNLLSAPEALCEAAAHGAALPRHAARGRDTSCGRTGVRFRGGGRSWRRCRSPRRTRATAACARLRAALRVIRTTSRTRAGIPPSMGPSQGRASAHVAPPSPTAPSVVLMPFSNPLAATLQIENGRDLIRTSCRGCSEATRPGGYHWAPSPGPGNSRPARS